MSIKSVNKVCMSDMFDLLKHSQISKFIIMLGEREKHSRKIEIKSNSPGK